MIATVKAYLNTGLSVNNCLDDISKLDSLGFATKTFSNIAIKQDRGHISIRINTTYDNVKDADYVKINDIGYWVTGIRMLNDNVADIGLQQDYVTTMGIANLEVVSGWCTRRSVVDDTIYSNVIDEEFVPTSELIVEGGTEISNGGSDTGHINIVLSNVDLLNLQKVAEDYTDASMDKVLVPQLPTIEEDQSTMYTLHPYGVSTFTNTISMTAAYNPNNANVLEGIKQLRSLGIESAIGASYQLPNYWVSATGSDKYSLLVDNWANPVSGLPAIQGTYKNNKVFSGQFQKIVIYSLCSGDHAEFKPEDIIGTGGTINWHLYADLRYNGYPVCKPTNYKGQLNLSNFGIIKGAGWQQTPFMYTVGQSGYAVDIADAIRRYQQGRIESATGALALGGSLVTTGVTMGAGFNSDMAAADANYSLAQADAVDQRYALMSMNNGAGLGYRATGIVNNGFVNKRTFIQSVRQAMRPSDQLQFPQVPQLQDYIGNKFYELRYRLSDNDMVRFDNFLTQYGYAVDEVLTPSCFLGRTHFNYVKGEDVVLKKSGVPQYLLQGAAQVIENGVRIWHDAPAASSLLDNPITT